VGGEEVAVRGDLGGGKERTAINLGGKYAKVSRSQRDWAGS